MEHRWGRVFRWVDFDEKHAGDQALGLQGCAQPLADAQIKRSVGKQFGLFGHPFAQEIFLKLDQHRHRIVISGLVEVNHDLFDRANRNTAVLHRSPFVQPVQ